jgi:GNAT superfamily N-acetyltransferase
MRLEQAEAELTRQYVDAYASIYPESGAESTEIAGGRVSYAGADSPLSRADAVGLSGPVQPEDLDAIERFLESRGARTTLETCQFSHQSLFDLAGQRGYRVEHTLNLFALPLQPDTRLRNNQTNAKPGIDVFPISKSPDDADTWCLTVGRGFASMNCGDPPYMDLFRAIFHAHGTTGYIATIDSKPAGAGALKIAGSVAYLSTASTMPSYRKRGVQAALIMARLAAAVRQGCQIAAILTSPGSDSERNVVRAGFAMAYTRILLSKSTSTTRQ